MTGMVVGGWEYIWSAYTLSIVVLVGYAVILSLQLRQAQKGKK